MRTSAPALICAAFALFAYAPAQPTHPYLLFNTTQLETPTTGLRARLTSTCTDIATTPLPCCYAALPVHVSGSPAGTTNPWDEDTNHEYANTMLAVAFRWQIDQATSAGDEAVEALCELLFTNFPGTGLWPLRDEPLEAHGIQKRPHKWPAFVITVALCYDWLYGHSHTTNSTYANWEPEVRRFLELAAYAMIEGRSDAEAECPGFSIAGYRDMTNNYMQGWLSGACFALMAIQPETSWSYTSSSWVEHETTTALGGTFTLGNCTSGGAHAPSHPAGLCIDFPDVAMCAWGNSRHSDSTLTPIYGFMYYEWADSSIAMIQTLLSEMSQGLKDAVNPGGWCEEEHHYANMISWVTLCGIAEELNTFSEIDYFDFFLTGYANEIPRWISASFFPGAGFPFAGDNSRGEEALEDRLNPIWYWLAQHSNDSEAFWGLERIREHMQSATSDLFDPGFSANRYMRWLDPNVLFCILYQPIGSSNAPRVWSHMAQDTMNVPAAAPWTNAPSTGGTSGETDKNRFASRFDGPGEDYGARFYLHNTPRCYDVSNPWVSMGIEHIVHREWVNHGHEDSGHVSISWGGKRFFIDRGRQDSTGDLQTVNLAYGPSHTARFESGQNFDHNVVVTVADSGIAAGFAEPFNMDPANSFDPLGANNPGIFSNIFNSPNGGEFADKVVASSLAEGFDYVHGDHRGMWMMSDRADRHVLFLKHFAVPYVIVLDDVEDDENRVFQQNWWSYYEAEDSASLTQPWGGTNNPLAVNSDTTNTSLYSFWLLPASVSVLKKTSPDRTVPGGIDAYFNRVKSDETPSTGTVFLSFHTNVPTQSLNLNPCALTGTNSTTLGFDVRWYFVDFQDTIAYSREKDISSDQAAGDARIIWYRHDGSLPSEWVVGEVDSYADLKVGSVTLHAVVTDHALIAAGFRFLSRVPQSTYGDPVLEVTIGSVNTSGAQMDLLTGIDLDDVYINGKRYDADPLPGFDVTKTWLSTAGAVRLSIVPD